MAAKNSKTTNKKPKSTKKTKKAPDTPAPSRRWIGVLVCLILFLISVLSCLNIKSIFTDLWAKLTQGLFGVTAFYVLPFSLIIMTAILLVLSLIHI